MRRALELVVEGGADAGPGGVGAAVERGQLGELALGRGRPRARAGVLQARNGLQHVAEPRPARAQLELGAAGAAYRSSRSAYGNWVAARNATTDPRQDPEVLKRTRELDTLQDGERKAREAVEALEREQLEAQQAAGAARRGEAELLENAQEAFESATFRQELRVFGARLAVSPKLTLNAQATRFGWSEFSSILSCDDGEESFHERLKIELEKLKESRND